MKLKEEYQKLNETMPSMTMPEKLKEIGKKFIEVLTESLPVALLDKGELESRLGRIRADLVQAQESLERSTRSNEKITRRNTRIQVIQEQTDEFLAQLEEQQAQFEVYKETANNLEVLKKAFSTNGLIAYKIENLVKDLEELTNHYLAELSDGRFTLEFVVSNDKLNVQITDNGNIVDILGFI